MAVTDRFHCICWEYEALQTTSGIPANDKICRQWRMFSSLLFLLLRQHNDTKEYYMVMTKVRRKDFVSFCLKAGSRIIFYRSRRPLVSQKTKFQWTNNGDTVAPKYWNKMASTFRSNNYFNMHYINHRFDYPCMQIMKCAGTGRYIAHLLLQRNHLSKTKHIE